MGVSSSNKQENYFKAYKKMIFINEITNNKIYFNGYLINVNTIPNFIKIIENSKLNNNNIINSEKIIKNAFKYYKPEKKIKLYYLFEECKYISNKNLENENKFIIVNEHFFNFMNIKILDKNDKYVIINIDKNKSDYSITFPLSNKSLNFIELNPGIYQFKKYNINKSLETSYNNNDNSLLNKIKSKYIIYSITSYIKDENFLLKLINYSKYFQNRLDININNYKEVYYGHRINYDDFLKYFYPGNPYNWGLDIPSQIRKNQISKDELFNLIENQNNKNDISKFMINYLNRYYNNLKDKEYSLYEYSKDIDITCPLYNSLLKTDLFSKILNISISIKDLEDDNIKNKFKSNFEILNKNNINYSSITFHTISNEDLNILKELNIDLKKIKKLKLLEQEYYYNSHNPDSIKLIDSLNVLNNLVYFETDLSIIDKNDPDKFEIINNFKSLKYLILSCNKFTEKFELKLNHLRKLKLHYCSNIFINKCNFSELKYLELIRNEININEEKNNSLIECPELNTLILEGLKDKCNYNFNFNNFKKLKNFEGKIKNFLLLGETPLLENIILTEKIEQSDLKLIIKMEKEYKRKKLSLNYYDNYNSVKKLELNISDNSNNLNLDLNKIQKMFPNLSDLIINGDNKSFWLDGTPINEEKKLIITEDENSKIKNIKIVIIGDGGRTIKFSCKPYDKIESFDLTVDVISVDFIPIFKSNCNIMFKSLKIFNFTYNYPYYPSKKEAKSIFENLYNNIDKMPNLIEFNLSFINDEKSRTIIFNKEFFKNFIKKIMISKSIKNIYIKIREGLWGWADNILYSREELKQLFPEIDFNKFHKVNIYEFIEN